MRAHPHARTRTLAHAHRRTYRSGGQAYCYMLVKACPTLWSTYAAYGTGQDVAACMTQCNGLGLAVIWAGHDGPPPPPPLLAPASTARGNLALCCGR